MGRSCDKQELNSGKKEVVAVSVSRDCILMGVWKYHITMQMSSAVYPAKSSVNSILLSSPTGQVEFCFYEPQRE